jgi:hypothetical protein
VITPRKMRKRAGRIVAIMGVALLLLVFILFAPGAASQSPDTGRLAPAPQDTVRT